MIIIPAIDLKDGKCVRLSQGEMNKATVYSQDPAEVAVRWESLGAKRLHVVDLDGAISVKPKNLIIIKSIRAAVSMPIQLGGGIRNIQTIDEYLCAGIDYVILGTAAIKDPILLEESCKKFPGNIIIGIDARDGMIAVQGWTETTNMSAVSFAQQLDSAAVKAIVFTDISRDGMLVGPNIESTSLLAEAVSIPVIASGGVSQKKDIERLLEEESSGISGVIVGRALYTGNIDLKECIALAEKR
jgi:phosphoribosylformimino-5-aminoimidazole carboxamide ribotide isomerase